MRQAIHYDDRMLRLHQKLCRLLNGSGVALGRRCPGEPRDGQLVTLHGRLDQIVVQVDNDRSHGRCDRDLVGPDRGLGKVLGRTGCIVPLCKIPQYLHRVLGGVDPVHQRPAIVETAVVPSEYEQRYAVAPGVVDRHGGMLKADRAVCQHRHGLARHF